MPPKRKRADDAAPEASNTSTRTTRSSTRVAKSRAATAETEEASAGEFAESAPQAKRAKKPTAKATALRTQSKGRAKKDAVEPRADDSAQETTTAPGQTQAKAPKLSEPAPYTPAASTSLFDVYADPDDPTVIGPEGFERLCSDAEVSLEGALPLILAWQMGASEMAKISKQEWAKATADLRISNAKTLAIALHDLEDLLLLNRTALRPAIPASGKKLTSSVSPDPYDRSRYYRYASDPTKAFNELYAFCFALAKPPQARNIDMETASAFWSVLLVPKYPLMSDILQFIAEKSTYKGVNKDLWTMTLEFCRAVQPDLSNYDPDGAWPTMLDDFVSWKNSNAGGDAAVTVDA